MPGITTRGPVTDDPDSTVDAHLFLRTRAEMYELEEGEVANATLGPRQTQAYLVRLVGSRAALRAARRELSNGGARGVRVGAPGDRRRPLGPRDFKRRLRELLRESRP